MGVFYGYVVKKNVLNVYEIRFIVILIVNIILCLLFNFV